MSNTNKKTKPSAVKRAVKRAGGVTQETQQKIDKKAAEKRRQDRLKQ